MHTVIVMFGGIALLIVILLAGWTLGATGKAALAFLPVWFIGSAINMWVGVTRAGYSVTAELPIFLLVFSGPAVLALLAWRCFR